MNKFPQADDAEIKKLRIQNENLKLSLANISSMKQGTEEQDKYNKFIKTLNSLVFTEIKRRLQILKLPNPEKLNSKIGG